MKPSKGPKSLPKPSGKAPIGTRGAQFATIDAKTHAAGYAPGQSGGAFGGNPIPSLRRVKASSGSKAVTPGRGGGISNYGAPRVRGVRPRG